MSAARGVALGLTCLALGAAAAAQTDAAPRYAQPIADELARMGIAAECRIEAGQRQHCSFRRAAPGSSLPLTWRVEYSDQNDTIYAYAERYLTVPSDHPQVSALLRRLMELNWELLIGKFEWNARSGEVRLSATLHTDSNFDRRALRSVLRSLEAVAARYASELQSLAAR